MVKISKKEEKFSELFIYPCFNNNHIFGVLTFKITDKWITYPAMVRSFFSGGIKGEAYRLPIS